MKESTFTLVYWGFMNPHSLRVGPASNRKNNHLKMYNFQFPNSNWRFFMAILVCWRVTSNLAVAPVGRVWGGHPHDQGPTINNRNVFYCKTTKKLGLEHCMDTPLKKRQTNSQQKWHQQKSICIANMGFHLQVVLA